MVAVIVWRNTRAAISEGIVGGFELTVLQTNLKE